MSGSATGASLEATRWQEFEDTPGAANLGVLGSESSAAPESVDFVPVVDLESWRRVLRGNSPDDALEDARREAYRFGHERGRTEGIEQTVRELGTVRDLLALAADEVRNQRDATLRAIEEEMVRLALGIAERVVRNIAEQDRELVISTVTNALRRVEGEGHLTVRVNPDDLELIRSARETFHQALDGLEKLEFIGDRRVGRGGCVVETASSRIDARVDAQLSELSQAILDHLEEQHARRLDGDSPGRP